MFSLKKSSLILLITLVLLQTYVSTAADNDDKKVRCERKEGDGPNAICTLEYNPVCGYHDGDDQGTTSGNPCGACHQELYDYYIPGECEDDNNQGSDNDDDGKVECKRNPGDGPGQICTMELNPVCAYHKGDDKGTTVGNPCGACHQELYDYYYPGACEGDDDNQDDNNDDHGNDDDDGKVECTRNPGDGPNQLCTMELNPVCAYHKGDDHGTTVGNPCGACHQELYDYYYPGACEGDDDNNNGNQDWNDDDLEYCEDTDEEPEPVRCNTTGSVFGAVDCSAEWDPICGYFDNDTNRTNGETASNACNGCYYSFFDYYLPGACEHRCNRTGTVDGEVACTADYTPVCGYFDNDTKKENGKTAGNACTGCFFDYYDFYVDGACPGDEQEPPVGPTAPPSNVTRCPDLGPGAPLVLCAETWDPVCAYNDEGDSGSGTTVSNECIACNVEPMYDYYTVGECA